MVATRGWGVERGRTGTHAEATESLRWLPWPASGSGVHAERPPRSQRLDHGGRHPSVAFPTLVFRSGGVRRSARLPEIRFEGLVGLTPPLSYSLPQRTGRVFNCERDYSRRCALLHVGCTPHMRPSVRSSKWRAGFSAAANERLVGTPSGGRGSHVAGGTRAAHPDDREVCKVGVEAVPIPQVAVQRL